MSKPGKLPTQHLPEVTESTFRGRGSAEVFPGWKLLRTIAATGGPFANPPVGASATVMFTAFHAIPLLVSYPDPTVLTGPEAMWGLYITEDLFDLVAWVGGALWPRIDGMSTYARHLGLAGVELLARRGVTPDRALMIAKLLGAGKDLASARAMWDGLAEALTPADRQLLGVDRPDDVALLHYLHTAIGGAPP